MSQEKSPTPMERLVLPLKKSSIDLSSHGYEMKEFGKCGRFGTTFIVESILDGSTWLAKAIGLSELNDLEKQLALQEASVLQTMQHPRIVMCKESFITDNDFLVLILEYCELGDLAQYLADWEGPRDTDKHRAMVVKLLTHVAEGLRYIHSKSIMHRDLKPSNILVTKNGDFKLGDFGISRLVTSVFSLSQTTVGTPQYMAPETCAASKQTFKTDIWALGCILYEALTFQCLFSAASLYDLVLKVSVGHALPALTADSFCGDLFPLLRKCLCRNPLLRPTAPQLLAHPIVRKTRLQTAFQVVHRAPRSDEDLFQALGLTRDFFNVDFQGTHINCFRYDPLPVHLASKYDLASLDITESPTSSLPSRSADPETFISDYPRCHLILYRLHKAIMGLRKSILCSPSMFADHFKLDSRDRISLPCWEAILEKAGAFLSAAELNFVWHHCMLKIRLTAHKLLLLLNQPQITQAYEDALCLIAGSVGDASLVRSFQEACVVVDTEQTDTIDSLSLLVLFDIFFPDASDLVRTLVLDLAPKTKNGDIYYHLLVAELTSDRPSSSDIRKAQRRLHTTTFVQPSLEDCVTEAILGSSSTPANSCDRSVHGSAPLVPADVLQISAHSFKRCDQPDTFTVPELRDPTDCAESCRPFNSSSNVVSPKQGQNPTSSRPLQNRQGKKCVSFQCDTQLSHCVPGSQPQIPSDQPPRLFGEREKSEQSQQSWKRHKYHFEPFPLLSRRPPLVGSWWRMLRAKTAFFLLPFHRCWLIAEWAQQAPSVGREGPPHSADPALHEQSRELEASQTPTSSLPKQIGLAPEVPFGKQQQEENHTDSGRAEDPANPALNGWRKRQAIQQPLKALNASDGMEGKLARGHEARHLRVPRCSLRTDHRVTGRTSFHGIESRLLIAVVHSLQKERGVSCHLKSTLSDTTLSRVQVDTLCTALTALLLVRRRQTDESVGAVWKHLHSYRVKRVRGGNKEKLATRQTREGIDMGFHDILSVHEGLRLVRKTRRSLKSFRATIDAVSASQKELRDSDAFLVSPLTEDELAVSSPFTRNPKNGNQPPDWGTRFLQYSESVTQKVAEWMRLLASLKWKARDVNLLHELVEILSLQTTLIRCRHHHDFLRLSSSASQIFMHYCVTRKSIARALQAFIPGPKPSPKSSTLTATVVHPMWYFNVLEARLTDLETKLLASEDIQDIAAWIKSVRCLHSYIMRMLSRWAQKEASVVHRSKALRPEIWKLGAPKTTLL